MIVLNNHNIDSHFIPSTKALTFLYAFPCTVCVLSGLLSHSYLRLFCFWVFFALRKITVIARVTKIIVIDIYFNQAAALIAKYFASSLHKCI